MGILYLVATPIGNLEDLSQRALQILERVDYIAAEDTRQTQKILNHFHISTKTISYHQHNQTTRTPYLLSLLSDHDIALVSDAGMPAINDPGAGIVKAAVEAGFTVCPIPGPTAPIAALSASGLPTDQFLYLGFLPRRETERAAQLSAVAGLPYTLIFLETPQRLVNGLESLFQFLGDRQMAAARELTKVHEEFVRGRISEVLSHFKATQPIGEFTLVIAGAGEDQARWPAEKLLRDLRSRLEAGEAPSLLAQSLSAESGWSRREIYRLMTAEEDKPSS